MVAARHALEGGWGGGGGGGGVVASIPYSLVFKRMRLFGKQQEIYA